MNCSGRLYVCVALVGLLGCGPGTTTNSQVINAGAPTQTRGDKTTPSETSPAVTQPVWTHAAEVDTWVPATQAQLPNLQRDSEYSARLNGKLVWIDLRRAQVTDAGVSRLHQSLPACAIAH